MRRLVAAGLLLVSVAPGFFLVIAGVQAGPSKQVEVFLHCGLVNAQVEFDGAFYTFVTDDESANPPWFNTGNWGTFTLFEQGGELYAHGPWFTVHRLVPLDQGIACGM